MLQNRQRTKGMNQTHQKATADLKARATRLDKHLIKAAMEVERLLNARPWRLTIIDPKGNTDASRIDTLKRNRRELREHPGDKDVRTQMAKNIAVFLHYVRTR